MTFHCESFSSDRQPEKGRTLDRFAINRVAIKDSYPRNQFYQARRGFARAGRRAMLKSWRE
jgi:hypothetical protein